MRPVAMPPAFVSIINFANVNSIQLNQIEFRQSQEGSASSHQCNCSEKDNVTNVTFFQRG